MFIPLMSNCILCAGLFLVGCDGTGGTPTESNARAVFENLHTEEIKDGTIKIDAFQKKNGQKRNDRGVEHYNIEYVASVIYPKGVMPRCVEIVKRSEYDFMCYSAQIRGAAFKSVGQAEKLTGELTFEKTERGWRGQDKEIY